MNIGVLHVLIVHFPIGLGLGAVLADLLFLARRKEVFKQAGIYCLVLAAASSVFTVVAGLVTAESQELVASYLGILEEHKWWGIAVMTTALLAACIRLLRRNRLRRWWLGGYCLLMAAMAVSIALAGHRGGSLVHGRGFLEGLLP